jgi:hypothetical protein
LARSYALGSGITGSIYMPVTIEPVNSTALSALDLSMALLADSSIDHLTVSLERVGADGTPSQSLPRLDYCRGAGGLAVQKGCSGSWARQTLIRTPLRIPSLIAGKNLPFIRIEYVAYFGDTIIGADSVLVYVGNQ